MLYSLNPYIYVETDGLFATAVTFYVDGAQLEKKAFSTTYCDGDQPGCRWAGQNSATTSSRTGNTRQGGRWVPLAGPCSGQDDLYVTVIGGLGAAPITNQIQPFALAPGSFYQGTKVQNRVVTFSFNAKNENLTNNNPSLTRLHELRQQLVDLVKPDKTVGGEPFMIEYSDSEGDRPLYCWFRYEAGLEGEWDIRNGFYDSFPLRLLAVDPYWFEDNQNVYPLHISVASLVGYPEKISGEWIDNTDSSSFRPGVGHFETVETKDGKIYAFGGSQILVLDGATSAITIILQVSGGGATIDCMTVGMDGKIYFGGDFTTVDTNPVTVPVAAANIAAYDPITNVVTALGAGTNNIVYSLYFAKNGELYAGGAFTSAGGTTMWGIGRWDGGQWRTVGAASGVQDGAASAGIVYTMYPSNDGSIIYIGGSFVASKGGATIYGGVAYITLSTNLLSKMGTGFTFATTGIRSIIVGVDQKVYVGANTDILTEISPRTGVFNRIARYNPTINIWEDLNGGANGSASVIFAAKDNSIYFSGNFTVIGGINSIGFARYREGVWYNAEFYVNAVTDINTILIKRNEDIFINPTGFGNPLNRKQVWIPATNTITNTGTSEVYPVLYVKGKGSIRFIQNIKTGQALYMELALFSNEEVNFDFGRGEITSSVRGSLLSTLISGSEIRSVKLLPGENKFSLIVVSDVNCVAQMRYVPRHLSADAIVDADQL